MTRASNNFDGILDQTFSYAKKIGREFYFKEWRPNPRKCPAFAEEIVQITREGWDHLTHLRKRTKSDVLSRLFVMERAQKLLVEATVFQEHREHTRGAQKIEYWIFIGVIEVVSIKVIIRSIGGGQKHFLSVVKKGSIEKETDTGGGFPAN